MDPDFLEKIVFNILSNGFKYSIEGTIEVFVRYEADKAVFGVKDVRTMSACLYPFRALTSLLCSRLVSASRRRTFPTSSVDSIGFL